MGGGRLEEVEGVLQVTAQTIGCAVGGVQFGDRQGQVEPGPVPLHGLRRHRQPGAEAPVGPCGVLEGQHDLEERLMVARAPRVEVLDEPVEGQILVFGGGQVALPDLLQQGPERGIAGGVGPQQERVHEEADEVVEGGVAPARARDAERDVVPGAQPGQQHGEPGADHHEQGAVLFAGQLQ